MWALAIMQKSKVVPKNELRTSWWHISISCMLRVNNLLRKKKLVERHCFLVDFLLSVTHDCSQSLGTSN